MSGTVLHLSGPQHYAFGRPVAASSHGDRSVLVWTLSEAERAIYRLYALLPPAPGAGVTVEPGWIYVGTAELIGRVPVGPHPVVHVFCERSD